MDISKLSHGAKVVLGAALAYFIVLFFHWQEVDLGGLGSYGRSGWHGVGVICGLLAIAIVVWQAVRLANINFEIGVTPSMVTAALALLLVVFTVIKFLADNEARTFWAWLGLILAIVVAVGAWMNMQAAGEGIGDIKAAAAGATAAARSAADSRSSASTTGTATPPAPAAPAAPAVPEPPVTPSAPDVPSASEVADDAADAARDAADENRPT